MKGFTFKPDDFSAREVIKKIEYPFFIVLEIELKEKSVNFLPAKCEKSSENFTDRKKKMFYEFRCFFPRVLSPKVFILFTGFHEIFLNTPEVKNY